MGKGNGRQCREETLEAIGGRASQRHTIRHGDNKTDWRVGGEEIRTTRDGLRRTLIRCLWITSLQTQQRNGYGEFATREEALKAVEQLDGWLVWGYSLRVTKSKYRRN
ncbi:hypothetical protein PIB30_085153 [Stylosanthes scabra]|uniref:RRM domain-containing protein n=1 Tax=Stylosanthes scabra TaxID=79078 RepID=A0ABU6WUH3_9FABA|nr:hypothetical protein [Stylosanthes scabra]